MRRRSKQPLGDSLGLWKGETIGVLDARFNARDGHLFNQLYVGGRYLGAIDQPPAVHHNRVALLPESSQLARHVAAVVVLAVPALAKRLELYERGAEPLSG